MQARRKARLLFRFWRHHTACVKHKGRMEAYAVKIKGDSASQSQDDQTVLTETFFFWRSWAQQTKLSRLLEEEARRLRRMVEDVRAELHKGTQQGADVSETIQMINLSLEQLSRTGRKRPVRPDLTFAPHFLNDFFTRCERELAMLKDIPLGCYDLSCLAPDFQPRGGSSSNHSSKLDEAVKAVGTLGARGKWAQRQELLEELQGELDKEEAFEQAAFDQISSMEFEDLLIGWLNRNVLTTTKMDGTPFARTLKDLSTDLRDSEIYVALLKAIAPSNEAKIIKVEKLVDLHARAKAVIGLFRSLGCHEVLSEYDYVEGVPDQHLLQICSLFLTNHGVAPEPGQRWFDNRTQNIHYLRDRWAEVKKSSNVPDQVGSAFLSQLLHLSTEIAVVRARLVRRDRYCKAIQRRTKDFMWMLHRSRSLPDNERYDLKHLNNIYQTMVSEQSIGRIIGKDDPEGARHELKLINKIFSRHRDELRKITKHYLSQSRGNTPNCIDFPAFMTFVKDCGFLLGPREERLTVAKVSRAFALQFQASGGEEAGSRGQTGREMARRWWPHRRSSPKS